MRSLFIISLGALLLTGACSTTAPKNWSVAANRSTLWVDARRVPGVAQRIVLFSESGDLHLTEEERKQAREIEVPWEFLRELGRPPADFIHVTAG